ncbi:hypothetical protein T4E_1946 [Trichinella pseudospiralis]|uniref:Uncharacterized protein n=1 Tax=Trichinella pseudospiralis TaxID=6337 RepID=A0A0V0XDC3_TRIPS|nr:hypothetical protein T4E_1946 [Trichinella pseudospiralis]
MKFSIFNEHELNICFSDDVSVSSLCSLIFVSMETTRRTQQDHRDRFFEKLIKRHFCKFSKRCCFLDVCICTEHFESADGNYFALS